MKQRIIISFFLLLATITVFGIIKVKKNTLPIDEINQARKLLSEAEMLKSPRYSEEYYLKASQYYDSAMNEWGHENQRFILFRSYQKVGELAEISLESSKNAIQDAKKNISDFEEILEARIILIGKRLNDFESCYGNYPMNVQQRDEIAKSKLLYSEGELAFKNKNYSTCKSKLDSVDAAMKVLIEINKEKLEKYMEDFPKWKEASEQTINYSKRNRCYSIIIDKLARECRLYKDGKMVSQYKAELGINWMGDKNQQGDKSTPEGLYKIIDKKSKGQTRYYKALLLDYPNEQDKKRFLQNKRDGLLEKEADIGSLIELHGQGGKGIDWTDGCVALKDADIDEIFKFCPLGTKVTIVGSTRSFEELKREADEAY